MDERMEITPLAFDSFGARSMATFVETDDVSILIDPGVALGPSRHRLPPHPLEIERELELWQDIKDHAARADVLVVSHYHYDHHNPEEPMLYGDKILYIKHPEENINKSQTRRASYFLKKLQDIPKSIKTADGSEFVHGKTLIRFSDAVCHGTNPRLGYVVQTSIECGGEKFIHTSDVEGPAMPDQIRFVIEEQPDVVILDGPMTYMLGFRYSKKSLELSIENMIRIITETPAHTIIPDHHFMRDLRYRERIAPVYEAADDAGKRVTTAAEYAGRDIENLEARRKELYSTYPIAY